MRTPRAILLAAGASFALALAAPAPAQEAGPPVADEVVRLLGEGQALLDAGDPDGAVALFNEANDLTFTVDDLEALVKHRPNLYQARYYKATERWQSVETFATSVASALDTDDHRDHPFRIEAILLQGIAAARQRRGPEAERLLRNAVAASAARPELRAVWEEALFELAEVATGLGAVDAAELRDQAIASHHPGHAVPRTRVLDLEYLRLFERRSGGADPAGLVPDVLAFMDDVAATADLSEASRSLFKGFLGLVLLEAGDYTGALPLFEERHAYLVATESYGSEFFWNIQRIALARFNIEDAAAALAILDEWVPRGAELGAPIEQIAILTENIGQLRSWTEDVDGAQQAFRDAYEMMRQVRRSTDEMSLRIARRIDPQHPGMADFPLRFEIASDWAPPLDLDETGSDVVRLFFTGDWRGVEAALAERRENGEAATAVFLLNDALFRAMTGDYDASQSALAQARKTARKTGGATLPPDAMAFDVVDVVARIWGSAHVIETARGPLDRLKLREPDMTPLDRSVYLSLEAFYHFRLDELVTAAAFVDRWLANHDPAAPKTPWEIFAGNMVLEASSVSVGEDEASAILDRILTDLSSQPELELAETYARLVHRINGATTLLSDGALTELGAMVQRMSVMVPPSHSMLTATQFGMANALNWRGRWADALVWYERTTEDVRASAHPEPGVLAFLLSEQANMLVQLGEPGRAAVLAREALDDVDIYTDRPNLVSGVVEAYVNATWSRTGSAQRGGDLAASFIEDERYFDRIPDFAKVRLLNLYVSALTNYGTVEDIRAAVARADAIMTAPGFTDWRVNRSSLAWQRAIAEYWSGDRALGFEMMRRSNDIYIDWRDDVLAEGATEDVGRAELLNRARWEALIGWDYAEGLPE